MVPITFSRGCRWGRCRFCGHNFSFAAYRARGITRFVDDLETLRTCNGIRHFYWADQYIGADDLLSIAGAIADRQLDIRFHVMARAEKRFTPYHFEKLAAAGCCWISWGIESGSQRLLDLCRKGVQVATIEKLLQWSSQASINNLAMMIFGLPTGTRDDLDATLRFFERTAGWVDSWTASSFVLFDKTPFACEPQRYGLYPRGAVPALCRNGVTVASTRLNFGRDFEQHGSHSVQGADEVAIWQRFRAWAPPLHSFDDLVSEHYLLYADQLRENRQRPPQSPPCPSLPRAA